MPFNPGFKKGDIVSNELLRTTFGCSSQGGMRRSLVNKTLVIVSDHTRGVYEDRWIGDVLHYTGEGLKGDQSLANRQNKTLMESNSNGVEVFLFEVFESTMYVFQGAVQQVEEPYQEVQPDSEGNDRKVWVFRLKLKDGSSPAVIDAKAWTYNQTKKQKSISRLSDAEVKKRAGNAKRQVGTRDVSTTQFERDGFVSEWAKRRAKGICDLCEKPAPFTKTNGEPYLEVHHVVWLSKGGADTIQNTVALCPNCHRKMHILNDAKDRKTLVDGY